MRFFKRKHLIRRYGDPEWVDGYSTVSYTDIYLMCDVQTTEDKAEVTDSGTEFVQALKVFCDEELMTEDTVRYKGSDGNWQEKDRKADRLWCQDKWFDCTSCRLSENTPLRHWTATFTECKDQEDPPDE